MILAAGDSASAGPLGILIIVLIGVATALLIKNMNGRLKRLPVSFPDQERTTPTPPQNDESASDPIAGS